MNAVSSNYPEATNLDSVKSAASYTRATSGKLNDGKTYYAKIWDDNILVRDYIPVLDYDMRPCMYDKVSGKFFYNQGTDEFLYG